jgi:AhpD family alkylhydroperoxidase
MCRLKPIEIGQIGPEARVTLDNLHLASTEVPNFLRVVAKSLAAMKAYAGMEHALARGQLSARERKQIALTVAEINGSNYCRVAHATTAKDAAMSDEDVLLARQAKAADPRENAMLRFTQVVVVQRGEIRDAELALVRQAGFRNPRSLKSSPTFP